MFAGGPPFFLRERRIRTGLSPPASSAADRQGADLGRHASGHGTVILDTDAVPLRKTVGLVGVHNDFLGIEVIANHQTAAAGPQDSCHHSGVHVFQADCLHSDCGASHNMPDEDGGCRAAAKLRLHTPGIQRDPRNTPVCIKQTGVFFYWVGKPPALPVEVPGKKL